MNREELYHFGIMGQKWGIRRYQNSDGSLTAAGRERYLKPSKDPDTGGRLNDEGIKKFTKIYGDGRRIPNDAGYELRKNYKNNVADRALESKIWNSDKLSEIRNKITEMNDVKQKNKTYLGDKASEYLDDLFNLDAESLEKVFDTAWKEKQKDEEHPDRWSFYNEYQGVDDAYLAAAANKLGYLKTDSDFNNRMNQYKNAAASIKVETHKLANATLDMIQDSILADLLYSDSSLISDARDITERYLNRR